MRSEIIVIERELLKSEAFRRLNSTAKNVLFDFLMKCRIERTRAKPGRKQGRVIINNGQIEYCYTEATKKGIKPAAFMRSIDQLIERGFIDITHSGTAGRKGDKNLYAISDRWKAWGTPEFINHKRSKDTRQGRGFAEVWRRRKLKTMVYQKR